VAQLVLDVQNREVKVIAKEQTATTAEEAPVTDQPEEAKEEE
jgi:hypothetical protein